MNILILTTHFNPGGISSYLLSLANALAKREHHIFIASSAGTWVKRLDSSVKHIKVNIRTKSELSFKILWCLFWLNRIINKEKIDIIHAQTRVSQVLAHYLSRINKIPYVTTAHGFFRPRAFRKIFPCWGDKVIAISKEVQEHLIRDFAVKKEDVVLINHGVDVEKFRAMRLLSPEKQEESIAKTKKEMGLGNGPIIGIIARLSDVKGHKYLIEAFSLVLKEFPGSQILSIGEGNLKCDLVEQAKRLGIEKNVFFIPSVEDTSIALSVMDVFVMPSLQEGLGLSIMEAQAAGIPVVASNTGGISTLIEQNTTGLLVEPSSSEAIAFSILRLLRDKEFAGRIALNALEFIKNNFSLAQMVSKTEEVYRCLKR